MFWIGLLIGAAISAGAILALAALLHGAHDWMEGSGPG